MADTNSMDILLDELGDAESVAELQTNVLAFNEYAEKHFDDGDVELAGAGTEEDTRITALAEWTDRLQTRMNELTETDAIDSYSVTVSGSLTGPSVSLSVTCSPGAE
jgi:hypothetical protein